MPHYRTSLIRLKVFKGTSGASLTILRKAVGKSRILYERQWQDWLEKYCAENVHIMPTYWHVVITLLVWLPLGVMAVCYTAIFIKLDRYEQNVLRRGFEHPALVSLKSRVARMMFIIVGVFIVCRVPFTVFVFWRNQLIKTEPLNKSDTEVNNGLLVLWSLSHYLIFTNAAVNPLIYGLSNEHFKREFRNTPLSHLLFGPATTSTTQPLVQSPPTKVKTLETTDGCARGKSGELPKAWFTEPKCTKAKKSEELPENNWFTEPKCTKAKKSEEMPETWFTEPRLFTKVFAKKSVELPKTWFTEPDCSKKVGKNGDEDPKSWFTVQKCTMKELNADGYI